MGPPPNVATALNNLAHLLQATNRPWEAKPMLWRALAIDEQSYGANHPDVARDLNNLALLLQDTNRLGEAELLMRLALAIFLDFTRRTGHPHPHLNDAIKSYGRLLVQTGLSQEQADARVRELAREYGLEWGGQEGE